VSSGGIDFSRATHPDLTPEGDLRDEVAPEPTVGGEGAPAAPRQAPEASPPAAAPAPTDAEPGPAAEAEGEPEWLQHIRTSKDPKEILAALTKNMSRDEVVRDPTLAGLIGDLGQKRAKQLLEEQSAARIEHEKRQALARGDTYRLGELTAPEVQRQVQQSQAAESTAPFMEGVARWQAKLPEEVQRQIQGRQYGAGGSYADGVEQYLEAVADAMISHRLNERVEQEIKHREPALRKAWLGETNGAEPSPERTNGHAAGVREITDEQIDQMSLEEYDRYFDEAGRPKAGVVHRPTRGQPIRQR
jgi:hypothetical protein